MQDRMNHFLYHIIIFYKMQWTFIKHFTSTIW
jgi:hypothetical protein